MKTKLPGVKHHESKVLPHLSRGGPVPVKSQTNKLSKNWMKSDNDKMQVYGDDLNEEGKPKFKTPEYYMLPPNDYNKKYGRNS